MTLNMLFSKSAQQPDGSGSRIELSQFVFCNRFPIARGSGVYRCGFKDSCGHAVGKGSIDDVTVTRNEKALIEREK